MWLLFLGGRTRYEDRASERDVRNRAFGGLGTSDLMANVVIWRAVRCCTAWRGHKRAVLVDWRRKNVELIDNKIGNLLEQVL